MTDAEKVNTTTRQSFTEDAGESKEVPSTPMPPILRNLCENEYKKVGRRALFKMDIVIMPTLMVMCILNYLDRNNIASAKLAVIMQIPSNMMLGRLKLPGVYICLAMAVWGIISAAQTVVSSSAGLAVYAFRMALIYSGSQLGNAFGGLLAIAILELDGHFELEGWRWLFLVEGVVTVGLAVVFAFILANSP
ncbi:hypothetical protein CEP53_004215 [Fusarium sp. AF-6]|nr:hypothetical protein CEP53_004215 [Fusarium sp. AF-6]